MKPATFKGTPRRIALTGPLSVARSQKPLSDLCFLVFLTVTKI